MVDRLTQIRERWQPDNTEPWPDGVVLRARQDIPWLLAKVTEQNVEIERLQAIVGKLPVTTDGVPMGPGITVWARNFRNDAIIKCQGGIFCRKQLVGCKYYSTEEAARAAKEKDNG